MQALMIGVEPRTGRHHQTGRQPERSVGVLCQTVRINSINLMGVPSQPSTGARPSVMVATRATFSWNNARRRHPACGARRLLNNAVAHIGGQARQS